jgi:prepilin-type processing-associated H-X9-DG protein
MIQTAFSRTDLAAILAGLALLAILITASLARLQWAGTLGMCKSNLRSVGLAFRVFATDHHDRLPMRLSITNQGSRELVMDADKVWFHFLVMSNELSTPRIPICPGDWRNRVEATAFFTNLVGHPTNQPPVAFNCNSNISYFVGLDANQERPNMLLAGDRSLTNGPPSPFLMSQARVGSLGTNHTRASGAGWDRSLHGRLSNLLFVDGSVRSARTAELREFLRTTGDTANRIAKPD